MKKDREHIEELVERYLAGTLDNEGTKELFGFLEDEPDLFDTFIGDMPVISAQSEKKYPYKSRLLKSYSDLSEEQFEYLCIASAEGDLTAEQQEELEDVVNTDEKRRATYNLYNRLRLPAEEIAYPLKNRLKKTTPFVRMTRVVTVVMSAAASVAILVIALNYNGSDRVSSQATEVTASVSETETPSVRETETSTIDETESLSVGEEEAPESRTTAPVVTARTIQEQVRIAEAMPAEEETESTEVYERTIIMPVTGEPAMIMIAGNFTTPGLTEIYTAAPVEYQGPLTLRDYLAIAFRERILGEEIPDRSPIKAYEIASAGVTGVNKLLGWEMDLELVKEGKGEPDAVMFSSRLVKFQTPVKKVITDQ
ncbi:MAG: hypothetical protein R6W67_06630 [Bacteroidales bacterium]